MLKRDINEAATRIWNRLKVANDGRNITDLRTTIRLAHGFGIELVPLHRSKQLRARLSFDRDGVWRLRYNVQGDNEEVIDWMVHELAEYLVAGDFPSLFDGLPGSTTYAYDGDDDPGDVRHRIAMRVEELRWREVKRSISRQRKRAK